MQISFLGTGANGGVPQLDCRCTQCENARLDPAAERLRSSLLIETGDHKIILDCGPDFRQQLQRHHLNLQEIDLVVITHLHFDHAAGLMELSCGNRLGIPILASEANQALLRQKPEVNFLLDSGYIRLISPTLAQRYGVTLLDVPHDSSFPTSAIVVNHVGKRVWYSPDVHVITDAMLQAMQTCDLLIFDATFLKESWKPGVTAKELGHLAIEQSAPILSALNKRVIYSHINHSEDTSAVKSFLKPFNSVLASDGLTISL
ncbi:hypothetical protein A2368_03180 [Candidatus Collierbacteria bacterium RIFOXYB1_FULL_49_13]|uniref:Metallo-beta-lactamase domain-containing protein n=1 Tax=Candidatus Collierbacteria bacterium RIFOXYB1_FULL_49_13 TaxID=1817728 RepID=A0A1F5FJT8_9BACT|nr:MAG: hypothetical protein A2368_03180 [Candidatus Collierbacteria bacterium RIFOXYB1_FULL_49_13]